MFLCTQKNYSVQVNVTHFVPNSSGQIGIVFVNINRHMHNQTKSNYWPVIFNILEYSKIIFLLSHGKENNVYETFLFAFCGNVNHLISWQKQQPGPIIICILARKWNINRFNNWMLQVRYTWYNTTCYIENLKI